jgi:hypothetical protein
MTAAEHSAFPADWLLPQWPTPPGVFALCTTRGGGASQGLFGASNLSFNVGDVPGHVQHNRQLLAQAMQALEEQAGQGADKARPRQPVFVRQVHGSHVQVLGEGGDEQPALLAAGPQPLPRQLAPVAARREAQQCMAVAMRQFFRQLALVIAPRQFTRQQAGAFPAQAQPQRMGRQPGLPLPGQRRRQILGA